MESAMKTSTTATMAPLFAVALLLVALPCAAAQMGTTTGCPGGASAASAPCGARAASPASGPHVHGASAPRMGMAMGNGTGNGNGNGMGMGGGMGMGNGMGMGGTAMSLMTPDERAEHQRRMNSFKSFEECRAYVDDLHRKLATRARERGVAMPAEPPHDPCADLPRLKH
jgi:hypothetical protein